MASGDNNNGNESDDEVCYPEPEYEDKEFISYMMHQMAATDEAKGDAGEVSRRIARDTKPKNEKSCSEQLKQIALEIDEKYGERIDEVVKNAQDITINYQNFREIANSLFSDGISISGILTLIMFGYRWLVQNRVAEALGVVIQNLVRYFSSVPMRRFIQSIGGWTGLVHTLSRSASLVFGVLACIFVSLAIYYK